MTTLLYIVIVFLLVFINGFFVAAEFALVGVRRSRIKTLAASGSRRAQRLLGLLDNLNAFLSASQLGITLASLGLGWLGEPTVARLLEEPLAGLPEVWRHAVAFFVAFAVVTCLHIVLGEQAPKLFGLQRAERVALATALPMQLFYKVFSWPIRALDWASALVVRPFGIHASAEHASIYTGEELRQIVDISRQSGHLKQQEQRLINRILDFADAEVREAMVPRTNVAALPVTATLSETKTAFRRFGYSRLPVYRERIDEALGVLFRRDIEPYLENGKAPEFDVSKLVQPSIYIPATSKLGTALAQMQTARTHLAFVIDEHGGLEGIVTLEDLLEEIVGEIYDEYDEETRSQCIKQSDGTYLLDGMLAVRDANRQFEIELPEAGAYRTLAGFLLAHTGHLPKPGDVIEYEASQFRIERVDQRRIRWVRFTPPPPKRESPSE